MAAQKKASKNAHEKLEQLEFALKNKVDERAGVLALYRRGRIDDASLDQQLKEIEAAEADLERALEAAKDAAARASNGNAELASAEELLSQLRRRLDEPISWEIKKQLVEVLLCDTKISTLEASGKKDAEIVVTYRFASPVATCTDIRADRHCTLERTAFIPAWPSTSATRSHSPSRLGSISTAPVNVSAEPGQTMVLTS